MQRKHWPVAAVLAAPTALACAGAAPPGDPSQAAESGAEVYAENCAACHGANAAGDGPAAPGLEAARPAPHRGPPRRCLPEIEILEGRRRGQIQLVIEYPKTIQLEE